MTGVRYKYVIEAGIYYREGSPPETLKPMLKHRISVPKTGDGKIYIKELV